MFRCTGGSIRHAPADADALRLSARRTGDRSGRRPAVGSPAHATHADFESFSKAIGSQESASAPLVKPGDGRIRRRDRFPHRRRASHRHDQQSPFSRSDVPPHRHIHATRRCLAAKLGQDSRGSPATHNRPSPDRHFNAGRRRLLPDCICRPPTKEMAFFRDDLAEDIRG